ncbi:MAG TPA: type IV pilin, partial [Acidimicrobiales bacterium]|nr:type IV pilin [Acidimicrobiales bacterium]
MSDVIATILLLALTVTLFAAIFVFVTSFPSPSPQNSNQFQGTLQLTTNGTFIKSVSILHLGGPSVAGTDTVYLKGALDPTYPSFTSSETVASGIGGGKTWNLGQSWVYTFPTPQPRLQNVTIYVVSPTQLLYSVVLPGQAFNSPPTVIQAWISPANPGVGSPFTIYAVFGGTTSGLAPTVNLAAI